MSHCIGDTHRDDKTNICMHEHVMTQCRIGWRSLFLSCSWFKPAKTIHPLTIIITLQCRDVRNTDADEDVKQ